MLYLKERPFLPGAVWHTLFAKSGLNTVESTKALVNDSFFGAIEGNWQAGGIEREELKQIFQIGLVEPIFCIGGIMRRQSINPHDFDRENRERSLRRLEKLIDQAYALNAKQIVLCSGSDVGPERRESAKEIFAETLSHLCRYAVEHAPAEPLWLGLEHFDREFDQKRLLGPSAETAAFIDELARDHFNIGITLDLSHLKQLGEEIRPAVRAVKRHLIHVHIANCGVDPRYPELCGDTHPRFGIEGGAVTVEDVITFLDEIANQAYLSKKVPTRLPVISFEIKPVAGEDPLGLIANGKRVLAEAVQRINQT